MKEKNEARKTLEAFLAEVPMSKTQREFYEEEGMLYGRVGIALRKAGKTDADMKQYWTAVAKECVRRAFEVCLPEDRHAHIQYAVEVLKSIGITRTGDQLVLANGAEGIPRSGGAYSIGKYVCGQEISLG